MAVYKMKKSLTIVPSFVLLTSATFVLIFLPYTIAVVAFAVLCLFCASILFLLSFGRFVMTDRYISHPFIIKCKKIDWDSVNEVRISKSTVSGYLYITISYSNQKVGNIILGDWFQNKKVFLPDIKKKAIKAKIYD